MATLPTLNDSPLLPSPSSSLRGLDISSQVALSGQLDRNSRQNDGLQYVAKGMGDIADAENFVQTEDDKRNAKDNLTGYSKELRTVLYGDGTAANPGYYNLQGDDAVNQRGAYQDRISALQSKYKDQTNNTQSSRLFSDAATAVTAPELDNIAQYSSKQKQVAFKVSSIAASQEAASRFMANPTNEAIRAQSAVVVTNEALSQADQDGIKDPVARANAVRTALSTMYSGAVMTELQRDVGAGRHLYEQYQGVINGDDQAKLENAIHTEQRAKEAEEEHNVVMQQVAEERAGKAAFNSFVSAGVKPGGDFDMSAIAADPHMDGSQKITLFQLSKAIDKGEPAAAKSRINTANLFGRMQLPDGDPNKITDGTQLVQSVINGDIGKDDWNWLNARLQENQTASGQRLNKTMDDLGSAVKKQLVFMNSTGQESGLGAEQFYNWQQYAFEQITDARKNGKDPYELLRPGSKSYIASPSALKPFIVPFDQQANAISSTFSGTPAPKETVNTDVFKTPSDVLGGVENGSLSPKAAQDYFSQPDNLSAITTEDDMLKLYHKGGLSRADAKKWYDSQSKGRHKATTPIPYNGQIPSAPTGQ